MKLLSKQEGEVLPALKPGEMRCILGKKGIYVERDTPLFTTCVQGAVNIPGLAEHSESVVLKTPPLTPEFLAIGLGFLRAAWEMHNGEAALILLYYPANESYEWLCPPQTVRGDYKNGKMAAWGADVRYTQPLQIPPGALNYGDMHSHPNFGCTPSWIDKEDEKYKDGLHLIAGQITGEEDWKGRIPPVVINADFVIDQGRYHLDEFEVIGGPIPDPHTWPEPPAGWLDQCTVVPPEKRIYRQSFGFGKKDDYDYGY